MSIIKDISDFYMANAKKEIKISLLRREFVLEHEELLQKLTVQLKKEVEKEHPNPLSIEKLVRSIKNIRDSIEEVVKTIPDLKQEHKRLISIIKAKEPDNLRKVKDELEHKLRLRGELE